MGAGGSVVKRGNRILDVGGQRVERFADIVVELQGNEFWIDVTFVNPGSRDSRSRGSLIRGGRAAEYREHTKKTMYALAAGASNVKKYFVPFVLESTGRMGNAATKWIKKWIVAGPSHRIYDPRDPFKPSTVLYRTFGVLCARYGAKMVNETRQGVIRMGTAPGPAGDEVVELDPATPLEGAQSDIDSDAGEVAVANGPGRSLLINAQAARRPGRPSPVEEEPLSRDANNSRFFTRCSNLACANKTASGLTDCICECGLTFCLSCDRVHCRLCPAAPRLDDSRGPLAARCGALGCTHLPTAFKFFACHCSPDTLWCLDHRRGHISACPQWACGEVGCAERLTGQLDKKTCGCGQRRCPAHLKAHMEACEDAVYDPPNPFDGSTICDTPGCTRDARRGAMVCTACGKWICVEHHAHHSNECRGLRGIPPSPPSTPQPAPIRPPGGRERANALGGVRAFNNSVNRSSGGMQCGETPGEHSEVVVECAECEVYYCNNHCNHHHHGGGGEGRGRAGRRSPRGSGRGRASGQGRGRAGEARSSGEARDSNDDIIHSVTTTPCTESPGQHGGATLRCGECDIVFCHSHRFRHHHAGGGGPSGTPIYPPSRTGSEGSTRCRSPNGNGRGVASGQERGRSGGARSPGGRGGRREAREGVSSGTDAMGCRVVGSNHRAGLRRACPRCQAILCPSHLLNHPCGRYGRTDPPLFPMGDQGEEGVGMGIWMMVGRAEKGGEVAGIGRYHLEMQARGARGLPAALREARQVGRSIVV